MGFLKKNKKDKKGLKNHKGELELKYSKIIVLLHKIKDINFGLCYRKNGMHNFESGL